MSLRIAMSVAAVLLAASSAHAQRREGGSGAATWQLTLPVPAHFGASYLAARSYRVTAGAQGLTLADPTTMIVLATVPAQESAASEVVPEGKVSVSETSTEVRIVLHHGDRVLTAVGKKGAATAAAGPSVQLAGPAEAPVSGPEQAAAQSNVALVEQAVPRYEKSVVDQCADRAHRARWATDDPLFVKCVCPQVLKWRLPKVSATTRVHRPLAKGKNGYSFTVDKDGRVHGCRVWAGVTPPAEGAPAAGAAKP